MKIRQVIDQAIADTGAVVDDMALAEMVSESLSDVEYREGTIWLLAQEIRRIRRNHTRAVEEGCFDPAELSRPTDPAAARRSWLDERILVPGREPTTWGQATIADHLARIEYLSRLQSGIGDTIARHVEAVAALKKAKARCLADLVPQEVAA